MKGIKNIIALILIELILILPIASSLTITGVETVNITATSTTVKWNTDEAADSKVEYGETTDLNESKYDSDPVTEHFVTLQDLLSETLYYYLVQSSDVVDNNSGNFYQFTTLAIELSLNVELPEFYNSDEIDINGTTTPGALVYVYVNDMLKRTTTASDGSFVFYNVRLDAKNVINNIKIQAKLGNKEIEKSFDIRLDLIAPVVILDPIPEIIGERDLNIKGTVNEEVTVEIYVDFNDTGYELKESFSASNTINIEKTITLEEGGNFVKIVVFDKAGNKVVFENQVLVDASPVRIEEDNIDELTPAYIKDVTIRGNVNKPGIDVFVAVNGKTSSAGTWSLGLQDLIRDFVKDIGEGDKDYHTISDINGNFEIPIELTDLITLTDEEIERLGLQRGVEGVGTGTIAENNITIIAIDSLGRNDTKEGTIYFGRCGTFGYWSVRDLKVSPSTLRADFVQKGHGVFTVTGDLEWYGPAPEEEVIITHLGASRMIVSREKEKTLEEELLGRATPTVMGSPDKKKFIMIFRLGRLPENETYAEKLVEYKMLHFLAALSIRYKYAEYSPYYDEEVPEPRTEKLCFNIDIELEREDISRRFKHADFLHSMTVNLDNLLNYIDNILKPTETVMKWNLIGCFGTTIWYWIRVGILYVVDCRGKFNLKEVVAICDGDKQGNCDQTCYDGIQGLVSTEKVMNYLCDRIVCPAAPSIKKHTELYKRSRLSILQGETSECEGKKCTFTETGIECKEECKEEYGRIWESVCLVDWPGSEWEYATNTGVDNSLKGQFRQIGSTMSNICSRDPPVRILMTVDGKEFLLNLNEQRTTVTIFKIKRLVEEVLGGDKEWNNEEITVGEGTRFILPGEENGRKVIIIVKGKLATCAQGGECKPEGGAPKDVISRAKELVNAPLDNYVLDPTKGIVVAARCGCISGMVGFLKLYKEMIGVINQCFKDLEEKGEKTAGMCERALSMYVCDMAWSALRCGSLAVGEAGGGREDGGIGGLFPALGKAASTVSEQIYGRYGSTNFYKVMFTEQQLVHSACMWAFTGDWDMGVMMDSLTEAAIPALESDGYIYPARRVFQYPDPITGKAVYYYDIGALLISGVDDLRFRLELVCSADNSCYRDNEAGLCDCFSIGEKRVILPGAQDTLDFAEKFNYGDIYTSAPLNYRFDKARLYWEWTDAKGEKHTSEKIVDIVDTGKAPAECKLDIQVGIFRCKFFIDELYASILELEPTKGLDNIYGSGDTLRITYKIEKRSPDENNNGGVDPDEVVSIYLKISLRNQYGIPIADKQQQNLIWRIDEEGVSQARIVLIDEDGIKPKHFGTIAGQGTISVSTSGNVVVDKGRASFWGGPVDAYFKIVFTNKKGTECDIFEWDEEEEKFSTKSVECKVIDDNRIRHAGIQVIFGKKNGLKDATITIEASGQTIYKDPTECTDDIVDWTLKAGLYYANEEDPTKPTNNPIIVNGQPVEERVRVKAQCSPTGGDMGYCEIGAKWTGEDRCRCQVGGITELCDEQYSDWCCDGYCFADEIVPGECPPKCDGGNGYCLKSCEDYDFDTIKEDGGCIKGVCCVEG